MQISRADVADLIYFMAIARHRSFSRAAIELGVSASALSHALTDPASTVPMVGASEAISGVLGAYLLLFPHARVL